jgi:ankyrin repeat protein
MPDKPKVLDTGKEMIKAAKQGNLPEVNSLLKKDKDLIHAKDKDGSTPLHCAAWKGHFDVARILLEAGAEVDAHNENSHWGSTPLHAAAHANQKAVVELLIQHGADINAKSPLNKMTPLDHAGVHKATAVAELLRNHGAK